MDTFMVEYSVYVFLLISENRDKIYLLKFPSFDNLICMLEQITPILKDKST